MLKERFSDICKVLSTTGEFFHTSCQVPDELPDEWLSEFKKRQLVTKIGDQYLIVRTYLSNEIRAELESGSEFPDKKKWQSQMEKLRLEGFSFSTLGVVLESDQIFDLTSEMDKRDVPEVRAKAKKCPNCGHKLSQEDLGNESCGECNESFWICPRCDAPISENPDDSRSCPVCEKTYTSISCPDCPKDVWADEPKCPGCGKEFKISKCPGCRRKLVISDALDECPYCGQDLYICPRCQEYIDEDPDDADSCPVCKKTLIVIDCPSCSGNVFSDSEKCEGCGKKLKIGKCPQCEKPLVLSENINECPYCRTDIKHVGCPHCQEEFYIETD